MSQHQSLATTETDTDLRDVELTAATIGTADVTAADSKTNMPTQQSLRFKSGGSHMHNESTLVWKEIIKFVDDGKL
jgi:hypothetical protein